MTSVPESPPKVGFFKPQDHPVWIFVHWDRNAQVNAIGGLRPRLSVSQYASIPDSLQGIPTRKVSLLRDDFLINLDDERLAQLFVGSFDLNP